MSEAYECDRCGGLREGEPHTALQVDSGYGRSRRGEPRQPPEGTAMPAIIDLCPACRNDLVSWYAGGGGDPSEVAEDE